MRGVLRCGVCWRNVETAWGRYYHTVWSDGSLRCFAFTTSDADYVHGHVVLDVPELRDEVRRFIEANSVNDERSVPRVEVEPLG